MPKKEGRGKAALISDSEYLKIRKQIITDKYKLLFDLGWYTGERWGALVQLKVEDIYLNGRAKDILIFPGIIRKHRPDGTVDNVEIPVHENLKDSINNFQPGESIWLFPSRCGTKPICWKNAYNILKRACHKAGLSTKGISTHSTRRSAINKMRRCGIKNEAIRKITGHRDNKGLEPYFEVEIDEVKAAIACL